MFGFHSLELIQIVRFGKSLRKIMLHVLKRKMLQVQLGGGVAERLRCSLGLPKAWVRIPNPGCEKVHKTLFSPYKLSISLPINMIFVGIRIGIRILFSFRMGNKILEIFQYMSLVKQVKSCMYFVI